MPQEKLMRLEGRNIVVTGGGRGIGRAYCKGFAAEGARVVVIDLDAEAAERVAGEIQSLGGSAIGVGSDVTDYSSMVRAAALVEERFGGVYGLVNNAGMLNAVPITRAGFDEIPDDEWDRVFLANVKGMWYSCKAFVPHMRRAQLGSIVNIGSGSYFSPVTANAHYIASKGAVIGLTRALSRELGVYGIRVNTLVPGSTLSEENPSPQVIAHRTSTLGDRALRRIEVPEDLVGTAVFLMSDDSEFMTGQSLVVDGGRVLN
jgi:3-oxoacyl-[acyl-carrier protein] reductase